MQMSPYVTGAPLRAALIGSAALSDGQRADGGVETPLPGAVVSAAPSSAKAQWYGPAAIRGARDEPSFAPAGVRGEPFLLNGGGRGLTASLSRHGALSRRLPQARSRGQPDLCLDRAAGAEARLLRRWAAMSSLALRLQRGLEPAAYGGLRAPAPPCPGLPCPGPREPPEPCPALPRPGDSVSSVPVQLLAPAQAHLSLTSRLDTVGTGWAVGMVTTALRDSGVARTVQQGMSDREAEMDTAMGMDTGSGMDPRLGRDPGSGMDLELGTEPAAGWIRAQGWIQA